MTVSVGLLHSLLALGGAFVFGLVFGSFVAAFSYRLPRGLDVGRGRSQCPACGKTLRALDLIPVLSWLWSRGLCRYCHAPISPRYPIIELMTATLFVAAAILVHDPVLRWLVWGATPLMVALAVIDIEFRRLPNLLLAGLMVVAIGFRWRLDADWSSAFVAGSAVFIGGLVLGRVGRGLVGQGLGMGDVKLMTIMAVALPWIPLLIVLGMAGLLAMAAHLIVSGGRVSLAARGPFGPALLASLWAGLASVSLFPQIAPLF